MPGKLEALIRAIYIKWKKSSIKPLDSHIDEEALACFLEGSLTDSEKEDIKTHLIACEACAESLALSLNALDSEEVEMPAGLVEKVKDIVDLNNKPGILEVSLLIKANLLEIIRSNGDILFGQELVPAPVLRSRNIKNFKDEVIILKDFKDVRVEIRIESCKEGAYFNSSILIKQKNSSVILKDLRVTLFKDDMEIESYLADNYSVTFEHLALGKYRLELSSLGNNLALVSLDIRR